MFDALNLKQLSTGLKLNARGKPLLEFNGQQAVISQFSEHPKWEIHPNSDEYLQVIEGELKIVLLLADGERELSLTSNDVCMVPRNVWHSPLAQGPVTLLSISAYEGTRISDEDDPR